MSPGTLHVILGLFQMINNILRMLDPNGRNPEVRAIMAKHVNGEIDEGEAVEQMLAHMRQRGNQVMEGWRDGQK